MKGSAIERAESGEWAEVHGQRYGTSWREIRAKSGKGKTLILVVAFRLQAARSGGDVKKLLRRNK